MSDASAWTSSFEADSNQDDDRNKATAVSLVAVDKAERSSELGSDGSDAAAGACGCTILWFGLVLVGFCFVVVVVDYRWFFVLSLLVRERLYRTVSGPNLFRVRIFYNNGSTFDVDPATTDAREREHNAHYPTACVCVCASIGWYNIVRERQQWP